jgi:hypothetical protein
VIKYPATVASRDNVRKGVGSCSEIAINISPRINSEPPGVRVALGSYDPKYTGPIAFEIPYATIVLTDPVPKKFEFGFVAMMNKAAMNYRATCEVK